MAAVVRSVAATQPEDMAELRLLIELPALRKLADRGLSDQELELVGKLASATMRAARTGNVLGYLHADMAFHLCLLELTGDPALSDIARVMLAPAQGCTPNAEGSDQLMASEASEHGELVGMFGDGMVSAADRLLRLHLSRRSAGRPTSARLAEPDSNSAGGA
jgi:DNA-binding GntR family transcriptional regulator